MKSHLLENSKLKPKDALQKRYLMFPSKNLPKNYVFKHSILFTNLYKRNYKERYLNEAYS